MRQKRTKTYKKLMALYSLSFGFRQPFQVLVDSEMCKVSVDHKIDIVKQLGLILQGSIKPMITQCCIHELYLQGKSQQPAVDLAKTFERRKCNHREAIPGEECLISVVGDKNKHRYVVASQSQPLRSKLRRVPGVPLVHINRIVVVLEPLSDATMAAKDTNENQSLHATASDLALVTNKSESEPPKKNKGPKAPNPLSVKKKKKKPYAMTDHSAGTKSKSGKEKERSGSDPRDLGNEGSDCTVGGKRKRAPENDSDGYGLHAAHGADPNEPSLGRRRKRRRKSTAVDGTLTGDAA